VTQNGYGYNVISDHSKDGFCLHNTGAPTLGWVANPGYNEIMNNNLGTSDTNQIYTISSASTPAKKNWWGTPSPTSAIVYRGSGTVIWSNYLTEPVNPFPPGSEQPGIYKGVVTPEAQLLANARDLYNQGNLQGAMDLIEQLIAEYPASEESQIGLELYVRELFKAGKIHTKTQYFGVLANNPTHPLKDWARIYWIDAALENDEYPEVVKSSNSKRNAM
jgi:hypothetical protein